MSKSFEHEAEYLTAEVSDLQRRVLLKHSRAILEEIYDQLKAKNDEIARLKQLLLEASR